MKASIYSYLNKQTIKRVSSSPPAYLCFIFMQFFFGKFRQNNTIPSFYGCHLPVWEIIRIPPLGTLFIALEEILRCCNDFFKSYLNDTMFCHKSGNCSHQNHVKRQRKTATDDQSLLGLNHDHLLRDEPFYFHSPSISLFILKRLRLYIRSKTEIPQSECEPNIVREIS